MANFKTEQLDVKLTNSVSINVLPETGHILPFAGPSNKIPTGWVLCDGTNGTPDLRGKIPGGITNVAVGLSQTHNHTLNTNIASFNQSSVSDTATIGNANAGGNNAFHQHNVGSSVYAVAWGDSGVANRSNGTQANVIGRNHSHGGTTSANANAVGSGNQSANHAHNFAAYSVNATTSNSHAHTISSSVNVSSQNIVHNSLPSIFYVNFIMNV